MSIGEIGLTAAVVERLGELGMLTADHGQTHVGIGELIDRQAKFVEGTPLAAAAHNRYTSQRVDRRKASYVAMPWRRVLDAHPAWVHWSFFVIWAITASIGPTIFVVSVVDGSGAWPLGLAIYGIALVTMSVDWLILRRARRSPDWRPWQPPRWAR